MWARLRDQTWEAWRAGVASLVFSPSLLPAARSLPDWRAAPAVCTTALAPHQPPACSAACPPLPLAAPK